MGLADGMLVVNIHFFRWEGQRLDRDATSKVTTDAHAASDAARVNKHLLPKDALEAINKAMSNVRTHYYKHTLPWKDNGDRVLLRHDYFKFMETYGEKERAVTAAVEDFLNIRYPAVVAKARFRMGTMFNIDEYPDVSYLRTRFGVKLVIDPVATAGDFRVDLDVAETARVKQQIEASFEERINTAMREVWSRLAAPLKAFAEKTKVKDAVFRDSLVENLEEIVAVIPQINLTNDPELEKIRADIAESIIGYDANQIRKDADVRTHVSDEAQRILKDMQQFMSAFGGGSSSDE